MGRFIKLATSGASAPVNASTTLEPLTERTVTTGAANTKGSASTSLGTTAANWEGFWVEIHTANSSAGRFLIDISFNNGSTWHVANLFANPGLITAARVNRYYIPLAKDAGSVVVARGQAHLATLTCQVQVIGVVASASRAPGYTTFTALNADTTATNAGGTNVPLNSGSWTSLVDPTAAAYGAILACIGSDGTTAPGAAQVVDVIIGSGPTGGASNAEIARFKTSCATGNPFMLSVASPLFPVGLVSGVAIAAKLVAGTTGSDNFRVGLYGLS